MKKLTYILVFIFMPTWCNAQSLSVFAPDITSYPSVKAKFYAIDDQGNQITNLSPSNFTVFENGMQRVVTNVSCPAPKPPDAISSVLVIDVSGSMMGNGLNMAKVAASTWVNCLPLGKSECAITSFDNANYFNQDFTTDKQKLLTAINDLYAKGGTDYDAAFLRPPAGGIVAAKTGQHKKVIVFLSDGEPNNEPFVDSIIAQGNQKQITIYAVILGMRAPDCIKKITTQTGGSCYDFIVNEGQVKNAYLTILHIVQGDEPCEIEWQSKPVCQANINVEIKLDNPQVSSFVSYKSPIYSFINFNPITLRFRNITPGVKADSIITVTANAVDFNVSDITVSNPNFDINPKNFLLKAGQSLDLTVSFTGPADSSYQFCKFEVVNDICLQNFYASGSYSLKSSNQPTIKITCPNGGEKFLAGSDTVITWEGVTPQDTVMLEYSSDDGVTWNLITGRATGLRYNWSPLPKISGNQYLIKGVQIQNGIGSLKDTMLLGMGTLNAMAVSHNGKYIASAGGSGRIYIWDAKNGTIIKALEGYNARIDMVVFSSNDSIIAAGTSNTDKLKIWDINTGNCIKTLSGLGEAYSIAFSPDGSKIAAGSPNGSYNYSIRIWDVNTGNIIRSIGGSGVLCVAYSPDGSKIASANLPGYVVLWDVNTGKSVDTINAYIGNNFICNVAFSPDGNFLAVSSTNGNLAICNLKNKQDIRYFRTYSPHLSSLVYSPDGTKLAGANDLLATVWDINSGDTLITLKGHGGYVFSVGFSNDSSLVSASSDNTIKLWDLNNGNNSNTLLGHTGYVTAIAYSPDGGILASVNQPNSQINFWDVKEGIILKTYIYGDIGGGNTIAFNPKGDLFAIGNSNGQISLMDVNSGNIIDYLIGNAGWSVNSVAFSPDGNLLASGNQDKTARIWDVKSRTNTKTFNHPNIVSAVTFSPDSKSLATCGWVKEIRIFDIISGNVLNMIYDTCFINSVAFNPDGNMIASGNSDNTVKLYDVNSGTHLNTLIGHTWGVNAVAFSPDRLTLASSSSDRTIRLWDANSGDSIRTLFGHNDAVESIAYSPDSTKLASGSDDGTCIIWNPKIAVPLQQDQSDSTFAIIAPQGRSKDIDMGTELVGSTKDSVVSGFIENLGTFPLTIQDVRIKGSDSTDFLCIIGAKPFNVDVGKARSVEFLFSPKAVGTRQALVEIQTIDSVYSVNIHGIGVQEQLASVIKIIDFGKVPVGAYKDTLLAATITNTSSAQMQITNTHHTTPNDKDFTTIAGGGAFTLNPGDTAKLSLRFKPGEAGRTSGGLAFDFNGTGSPIIIQLYGEGIIQNIPKCTLMSGSMEADAGDYIEVPIILQNSLLALQAGCNEVQTDLNFNSTLLYPLMEPRGTITNHVRTLHLIYPIKPGGSDTLGTISMEAAIGNAEATVLMLENPEIYGGFVSIDTLSGIFKLKNICKEGGTRLINPDGTAGIAQINPNPSSDEVELKINLKEKGRTSLEIINMLGTKVKMVFDEEKSIGENDIRFSTQDLGSGTYYLILKTPSEVITQQLIIMK